MKVTEPPRQNLHRQDYWQWAEHAVIKRTTLVSSGFSAKRDLNFCGWGWVGGRGIGTRA